MTYFFRYKKWISVSVGVSILYFSLLSLAYSIQLSDVVSHERDQTLKIQSASEQTDLLSAMIQVHFFLAIYTVGESISDQAREFEKRYLHYLARPPTAYAKQLTGITNVVNTAWGYDPILSPILIGNEQQALWVLQSGREGCQLLAFKSLSCKQWRHLLSTKKLDEESSS